MKRAQAPGGRKRAKAGSSDEDPSWEPPAAKAKTRVVTNSVRPARSKGDKKGAAPGAQQGLRRGNARPENHVPPVSGRAKEINATSSKASSLTIDDLEDEWNLEDDVPNDGNNNKKQPASAEGDGALHIKNIQVKGFVDVPGGLNLEEIRHRFWNVEALSFGGGGGNRNKKAASKKPQNASNSVAALQQQQNQQPGSNIKQLQVSIFRRRGGVGSEAGTFSGAGGSSSSIATKMQQETDHDHDEDDVRLYTAASSEHAGLLVASIYPNGTLTLRGDLRPRNTVHHYGGFDANMVSGVQRRTTRQLRQKTINQQTKQVRQRARRPQKSDSSSSEDVVDPEDAGGTDSDDDVNESSEHNPEPSNAAAQIEFEFEAQVKQICGTAREYLKSIAYIVQADERHHLCSSHGGRQLQGNNAGRRETAHAGEMGRPLFLKNFQVTSLWAYMRLPYPLELKAIAAAFPGTSSSYMPELSPTLKLNGVYNVARMRIFHTGLVEFYCDDDAALLEAAVQIRAQWKKFRPFRLTS
ncbi:unnamed protein product [Amoebophrya sp. A120]|nr:unnamed protein product [Amoebophrya sp. A120]|eukprot:GSA120T00001948001.1